MEKGYYSTTQLKFKKGILYQLYSSIYMGHKDKWVRVVGQKFKITIEEP